jgi:hypothetical protein
LLRTDNSRTDAKSPMSNTSHGRSLAERRYTDAAAILDSIPSISLRDAALALAR